LPRLVHQALTDTSRQEAILREVRQLRRENARRNRLVLVGVTCFLVLVLMVAWAFFGIPLPGRDS
jgi:type II secretory pathway component PulM